MYTYDIEILFTDPVEMKFPLITQPVHFYGPERKGAPAILVENEKFVKDADAYVIVSAEYNHNVPPALTNLLDAFPCSAYSYKPSGLVCYSMGQYVTISVSKSSNNFCTQTPGVTYFS